MKRRLVKRELLKWASAIVLAVGILGVVVVLAIRFVALPASTPDDQIAVTSRDGALRVGPATLVIELLDAVGEPLRLDLKVRCDALRIEGPEEYREPGFYDVSVTALEAGPTTLVIAGYWSDGRHRMTTSVPIDVLPAR